MSASTTTTVQSTSVYTTPAFWERLWRSSGIQSVGLFIIAYVIYGFQPQVGAPADALAAFYDGNRTLFAVGVGAVVLVLLGGTTWVSGGFWAPDGAYSRFVSPVIGLAWALVVSWVLLTRSPATRAGW
jgi:hypothetical protein